MKTNPLNTFIVLILFTPSAFAGTSKGSPFACLKDLIPLTDRGTFQRERVNVEKPFIRDGRYIVFPEVVKRKLTGFYVYDEKGAYYFDSAQLGTGEKTTSISLDELGGKKNRKVYQMVAQPAGLETVTIFYMPDFDIQGSNKEGPVLLGSSVLPVVGAFVSRPEKYDFVYQNPNLSDDAELKNWIYRNSSGRRPASAESVQIATEIVRLKTAAPKDEKQVWRPLQDELRLRKSWIKNHNLDDVTFKDISRTMDSSCRE